MSELQRVMDGLRGLDAQMTECMRQNRDPSDRADATYILTILERSEALLLRGDRLTAGTPDQQFFAEGLQQTYDAMRCIRLCMARLDDLAVEAARSVKH
ncbi:hypothetical protein R75471_05523 [Paraburkholderia domus]|uniref:hypothetical protein n=1 Tax=Paraburkholderia domus TaxID=2793075 RepID=UPI001B261F5C|nr:hypothetical protein [Paraburkholderia domus]CAE6944105.1 hypothetical protein R75471_05523 [Paraburkholderia domus]